MSGWIIALIVASIILIGILAWAVVRLVSRTSRLLDAVTQVTNRLQRNEVVEKVGVVLTKFADIEEIAKDKLGVDQKKDLEEMKTALEELRGAVRVGAADLGRGGQAAAPDRGVGGSAY